MSARMRSPFTIVGSIEEEGIRKDRGFATRSLGPAMTRTTEAPTRTTRIAPKINHHLRKDCSFTGEVMMGDVSAMPRRAGQGCPTHTDYTRVSSSVFVSI